MKSFKFLLNIFLLVFSISVFAQGIVVKPGTAVTIESGTLVYVTNGDKLLLEDDATYAPSFLEKGSMLRLC